METPVVLKTNNLQKNYKTIRALNGVSLEVPQGSVYGILGPNGSGKTTLLGIVLDILRSNGGSFEWTSFESNAEARKRIGSLLETPNFYHYLNAIDNLKIVSKIKNVGYENLEHILRQVGLWERKSAKFYTYSLGMKQRLAIAACLLSNPDILVFDEPTNGLDPEGIAEIRELIKTLNKSGKTVIIASHLLDEVEKVCTHVAILKKGELLNAGLVKSIISQDVLFEISSDNLDMLDSVVKKHPDIKRASHMGTHLEISFNKTITAAQLNAFCFEHDVVLNHLRINNQQLEKSFLELIKK